jgi:S-formylglutathione hydrolase FrmB
MSESLPYQRVVVRPGLSYGVRQPVYPGAPTLLLLALSLHEALAVKPYCLVGDQLHAQGWNIASLDLSGHGEAARPGEPGGLSTWAARLAAGDDLVAEFQERATAVLDHLVASGAADRWALAAAGTSRAGYMAFQLAAADSRVRAVAAFAPVTDLRALSEFASAQDDPRIIALNLTHQAPALANRATWISIGNADDRVGSFCAIAFTQALIAASRQKNQTVDHSLLLRPTPGHMSEPGWHTEAADWLALNLRSRRQMLPPPPHPLSTACMVYPPAKVSGPAPLVVHFYGSGGNLENYNMRRSSFARLRQGLHERGYWLVVPDLGAGSWLKPEAEARVTALIADLVARGLADATRIHYLGTSMGGHGCLTYAARHPEIPRSVCAFFPITDFTDWAKQFPKRAEAFAKAHGLSEEATWAAFPDYSPLLAASAFAILPVMLIHGDADTVVPVHHSQRFAAALRAQGSPVIYHEVRGGTHDNNLAILWQDAILDFFEQAPPR